MNPETDFNFLEQKIRLLSAADRFDADLKSARSTFDYVRALQTLGKAAVGMRYFYERASTLLKYINGHEFFKYASALRAEQVQKQPKGEGSAANLSLSFSELQSVATELHRLVTESISRLMEVATDPDFKRASRKALSVLRQGSEILNTIMNAKPEQHWIGLYKEGFKNSVD